MKGFVHTTSQSSIRQRRGDSDASLYERESSASYATRQSSRRHSGARRSIGNLFPLTGAGNAKHMLHIASRISKDVNLLYATKAELEQAAEAAQEQQQAEENAAAFTTSFINEPVEEEGSEKEYSTGSSSNSSGQDDEDNVLELDSDLEDYDHEAAGERIGSMLENLKCQDRIDIMDSLHTFYQIRREAVETEMEELETLEKEYYDRDEETKESLNSMVRAFESKGMTEVQVLVKCSATLQAGANGSFRQRQKFSKAAKAKSRPPERKVSMAEDHEEKEQKETEETEWKPKRSLKPFFQDEVKEEVKEDLPEEEEVQGPVVTEEDLKDQDVWDLNRARELWSRMNEKAVKVAGGKGSAIEILQAMVVVQEGSAELQRRAELAKKATATMNTALEFLTRNFNAGIVIDFENPSPDDEAMVEYARRLRNKLLSETDMDDMDEAPDAEELEEECQELERILGEQEKDIEAFQKQREEKEKSQEEEHNAKLEQLLDDQADPDADPAEERGTASKQSKSAVLDARLEGLQIQGAQPKASAAQRMKMAARTAAAISAINKDAPAAGAPRNLHSVEDFKDDPKVRMLREHIATKDGQIDQARKLLKRMRFERRLLHYCRKKAKSGFDDIVQEFEPPAFDDVPSADEASQESASEEELPPPEKEPPPSEPEKPQKPETEKLEKLEPSQKEQPEADGHKEAAKPEAAKPEAAKPEAAKPETPAANSARAPGQGVPSAPSGPALVSKIMDLSAKSNEGLEIEGQLKKEVEDLQVALADNSNSLREEKVRQKTLRKSIKDLRKEFHQLSSSDQDAPKTLEGLQEQIKFEEKVYRDLQSQIDELKAQVGQKSINTGEQEQQSQPPTLAQPEDTELSRQTSPRAESRPPSARESRPSSGGRDRSTPLGARDVESPTGVAADPPRASSARAEPTRSFSEKPDPPARSLSALTSQTNLHEPSRSPSARSGPSRPTSSRSIRGKGEEEEGDLPLASRDGRIPPEDPGEAGKARATLDQQRASVESGDAERIASQLAPQSRPQSGASQRAPRSAPGGSAESGPRRSTESAQSLPQSAPASKALLPPSAPEEGVSAQEEATTSVAELVKVQARTEAMREEIHDIDAKLKKLKVLLKSKGEVDIVSAVREILGLVHEEEVKAPPAFHQFKRELKDQQDKIRTLRKKWWDDHRDFDGLVEKVRNQMGGNRLIFAGPDSTEPDLTVQGAEHASAPVRANVGESPLPDLHQAQASHGFRGSANAPAIRPPSKETSNAAPQQGGHRRMSGLKGFGAFSAMNQGTVMRAVAVADDNPRSQFTKVMQATAATEARKSLKSLFG
ncbi:unnamed protein product [Symbiodinium natans]|uniref:Uncharacterized protein n=1 Tax=Symbiodinium natans TaxID=878477 RepID=A0A812QPD9_9DINO|nr:unnamed protein product [Symbiodinium natans]